MNKRGLDKLRRKAEDNLAVNDRKINGMAKADLAAMAHELAVHQVELEIQNEELLESRALVEETRDRYEQLFDFAPVGYFTLDEHYRIVEVNLTGYQLLKADKGKLKNKIFTRFIADGEKDNFYLHRKKALKTDLRQNFILQMKKGDGTLFYAQLDIIKDSGEKLRLAVSDISERKKAEDAQRQIEENYRTLFNSIDEGFCTIEVIFDAKGKPVDYRFLEINPAFERQTGLHNAEGKLMRSLAPEHEEHWFQIYGRIALTGKAERFVNEASALNRWYDVYAFRVGTPESRKVAILFNDITARKKAEGDIAKAKDELEIKVQERTAELKETEAQLRQRAQELETVMNVVPAAIWVAHDPACHNITGNQTANRFYEAEEGENVSAGPALGEPVPERRFFRNGKELTAEELPMQEAAARNVDIEGAEFNVLLPSGKSRTLWGSASPLRNDNGQVRGVVAAFVDITDRAREQEQLKESEDRFSKAFHSSPVGLSISRIDDGTFIDVNQSFLAMFGYKRKELIGQKAAELNIYDNPVERKEIVRRLEQQGKLLNYEVAAHTKAGAVINALTSAEKIEINGRAHIIWTTIDITDRKKAEESLRESEEKFRSLVAGVKDYAIYMLDPSGNIVSWNEGAQRINGYSAQDILGKHFSRFYTPEDQQAGKPAHELKIALSEGHFEDEGLRVRKDGLIFQASISITPIKDTNARLIGYSKVVRDITARKQAEKSLQESEEKFSKIFNSSPVGMVMTHLPDGRWVDANESYFKMRGYNREEVMGHSSNDLNLYPDADKRAQIFRTLQEQRKISNVELRIRTKSGRIIETLSSVEIIKLGGEEYSVSTNVDITERKKAESEINRLNRELNAIRECDQAIVHAKDEQTLLNDICRILKETAGYRMAWIGMVEHDENKSVRPVAWSSDEEYVKNVKITWSDTDRGRGPTGLAVRTGKTHYFQDFVTEAAAAPWRKAALAMDYRSSIAIPLFDERGMVFGAFTAYSPIPNYFDQSEIRLLETLAGDISFGITALRDIVKRRQAEAEINHLASFPELNPNPVIELNDKGAVIYANPAAKKEFPLIMQGQKQDYLTEMMETIRRDKTRIVITDISIVGKWFEQALAYVPSTNSYFIYSRDITMRKEAEEDVKRRSDELEAANKELEAFSYSVSHDLRAPLRSITGFSNVLLEDYSKELDDEGKSYLKKISDSGELMGQLMDDLLKLSRVTRGDLKIETLNLSDMALKIVDDMAKDEPQRKVKVTIAPDMTANGDKNLLGLVLENLLGNAWKYSSKTAEPRIEMGTVEHKGKTAYFVRDNGVGFDMTYANKLFKPFQRLHQASEFAGTGIGLATVQRIIRRHGGEVWTEAKVGEGASFYFTLS